MHTPINDAYIQYTCLDRLFKLQKHTAGEDCNKTPSNEIFQNYETVTTELFDTDV